MFSREKLVSEARRLLLNLFRYLSRSVVSLRRLTVGKAHLFLLGRVTWYSKWHRHPQHRKVHYSALALTCLLVGASIVTTLFPNPSGVEAAVATWDFTHDNTKYDYDSSKVSLAGGNASLTNPGSVTGASTNINAASGTTTNTSAAFASANKEYLTIPSNSSLQTGDIDFEIGGWAKITANTTRTILSKGGIANKDQEYYLDFGNTNIRFSVGNGSTYSRIQSTYTGGINGNWIFIRAWRLTDGSLNLQVNNGTVETLAGAVTPRIATNQFRFGSGSGTENFPYDGSLDSWYFQKRISTTAEATALYNAGAGRTYNDLTSANGLDTFKTGLTSWWDFNEESGTRQDAKGTNHLTSAADPIIAPPVYGSELLTNPSFETVNGNDFSLWTETLGDGSVAAESIDVNSGSKAVKLTAGSSINTGIYKDISVTAGRAYSLAFWSHGDGTFTSRYSVYDVTNAAFIITQTSTGIGGMSYALTTAAFVAPTNSVSIRVTMRCSGTSGGVAYYDDISVKEITTAAINNGGFDTLGAGGADVLSNWVESATGSSTISTETSAPYAGAYSIKLSNDSSASIVQLTQSLLTVGKRYSYSYYAKAESGTPAVSLYAGSSTIDSKTLNTSYSLYGGNVLCGGDAILRIRPIAANTIVYIDQVTLTSFGPTAEVGIAAGNAIDGNFAAGFNGTNQYLSKASNASLQAGDIDFEVGAWVYLDKVATYNSGIIGKTSGTGLTSEYLIRYNVASSKFELIISNGTSQPTVTSSIVALVNQWHFVRAWHNATIDKLYISVNNQSNPTELATAGVFPQVSTGNFEIGRSYASNSYTLPGRIDGAYKINRILTTDEANSLYNNGKGLKYASLPDSIKNDSALRGYWNLDEKSGTRYDSTSNDNDLTDNGTVAQAQGVNYYEGTVGTIFDASGNNNTFNQTTPAKRPTYSQSGINNKPTMLFDGVDDGLVATGDKIGAGDVTVTAVINARGWGGSGYGRIVDNGKFVLYVGTNIIYVNSDGVSGVGSAVGAITLNVPYIVTAIRTSTGAVNIYINGALSGTANQSSGTPAVGGDTYIGNRAAGDRAFDGNIGTVQVYNSILDPLHRNNLEKSLGEKFGITVATDAAALSSSASSSLYPTLSLNTPLRFSSLSSITPTPASSSTGTLRYQLTNNSNEGVGAGDSSSYYYHNGTSWVPANEYNAYQSNTATEIATNLSSFTNTILPTHNLKWRAFFVTDGVDSPALSSINANFISDTEPPPGATLDTAEASISDNTPLTTNNWYNYGAPSFTWLEPVDTSTIEYEQPSGIAGYLTYFGTDNTVNIGLTNGTVQTGINNAAFTWQTSRTYTVNQTLESGQTYYLKVIPVDSAGNAAHSADSTTYNLFTYKYDNELPTPLEYVQVAQVGCSTSPTFDLTWPASTDSLSGLKYYQYKVGVNGTINTTTNTTVTVAPERENENVFYVRPVDNANNSNPTLGSTIWQSTVFCSTQSVTLTSGPTYTKTLSTLTVDFETSRPTTSKVEVYKIKEDLSLEKVSTGEDTALSLTHSVIVPNLTPATPYKYKLFFKDQNNNEGESNYYIAQTDLISLSHTTTNNLENSLSSLTIIFETTKPARARVEVYKDTNKQQEVSTQDYTLNHHLTINNLTSGTTYTYKIFYIDQENNNYESSTYTTTTTTVGIVDLPTITSGPNSVNVTWKTNLPTTGQVQIKEGDTYKEPQGHITFLTDHNVTIQGLKSEKPYKLRIIWTDQSNKTDQTGWFDANTATSPSIGKLRAEVLSPTKALISWETNYLAQCTLQYGVGNLNTKLEIENKGQNFSKTIDNLQAGAVYSIRVLGSTEEAAEFSATDSFQTPPLPSITNFTFEPNLTGSTPAYKFTWLTNTETSTVVYYKVKGTGEYKSSSNPDLLKEHLVLIKDFEDQAIYEVCAAGTDKYGNVAKSDLNTITTPNDSRPPKITNLSTSVKSSGFADNQKAQVIVTWDTDELTTSQVEYANGIEGTEYQNRTKEETALSTSHVVVISDLEPSKIYHLRAISKDQANNPAYSQDTTVITGKVQKSVLDIILASLQKSLGWITKLFK